MNSIKIHSAKPTRMLLTGCDGHRLHRFYAYRIAALATIFVLLLNQRSLNDSLTNEMKQTDALREELLTAKLSAREDRAVSARNSQIESNLNDCLLHIHHIRGVRLYSQNDEDGALLQTLQCMGGHGTKEYFEFGSENGSELNTRILRDLYGWRGHLLDGSYENPDIQLHKEFFTPTNIVSLLEKYQVNKELDVLSVDCDIDDFFVTREILLAGYKPRVLINEFNINFGWEWSVSVLPKPVGKEQDPKYSWSGNCYYGASANAFIALAQAFGYTPVFANTVNLIFVRIDKAQELGLLLPSVDIFPGPFVRALHSDCPMKKWKRFDVQAVELAKNKSLSHVEFAGGIDEVLLDCKTFRGKPFTSSFVTDNRFGMTDWRVFTEVKEQSAEDS
ncbi:hypothetical protein ACHAW6_003443 [Cyclotella cf. meneghiniana]